MFAGRVLFTVDVQFTGYSGSLDAQISPASTAEQPSCAVCLGMFSSRFISNSCCNCMFFALR